VDRACSAFYLELKLAFSATPSAYFPSFVAAGMPVAEASMMGDENDSIHYREARRDA
jgi:hypothetical protein